MGQKQNSPFVPALVCGSLKANCQPQDCAEVLFAMAVNTPSAGTILSIIAIHTSGSASRDVGGFMTAAPNEGSRGKSGDLYVAAVEAIYDAAPNPTRWPRALQAIADCFEDVGANLIWRRDDGEFGVICSPNLEFAGLEYQQTWARHDIRAGRGAEQLYWVRGDAVTDRHLVTTEEIETHPFYTEFLAKYGLKWLAATGASPDPHVMVGISVQRANSKPPYSDAELDLLARFGRHAEKSLRLSIRLLDAELSKLALGEALTRVGIGVFALNSLKRVVFSNPAGESLLGDGLVLINGHLLSGSTALERSIDLAIRADPEDVTREPRPVLLNREKSARPLIIYVLPVRPDASVAAQFLTHTRAIVLIVDSDPDEPADPALVRDLLGLTLSEAKVAALVGAGLAPKAAAAKLGISEETARTALKRVFSKTGVSRQSELSALLTRLVLQ